MRCIGSICGLGWSGVDLFFVLSGFLITGILYDTRNDPAYYRTFYARRTLRIFPIYYLFVAIALVIVPFGAWHKRDAFFLVYLGYPAAIIWPSILSVPIRITHLWSLSVEEQFYMMWPWLIRKLWSPSRILTLCGVAGVGSLILRIAFPSWAYASLPCRMDGLAVGAALAVLFRQGWRARCERLAVPVFAVSATGLVSICAFRHTTLHGDRLISTLGFSVIAVGYGALLILSLGPLTRLFSMRVLRIFGKYSYGMYLYHFPLTAVFEHMKFFWIRYPLGTPLYVGACLAGNLGVAALSFHFFEQPILGLKKRFNYATKVSDPPITAPIDRAGALEVGPTATEGITGNA
jgi:peptidoglycan/LPS O-acetylase OafA/YrhL